MREWPAYIDLKKKIDDFNEMCPLLEMMANKAMKDRHWERLSKLCKYFFDVKSETFTLANVMQAPLLKYKDDVEVCLIRLQNSKLSVTISEYLLYVYILYVYFLQTIVQYITIYYNRIQKLYLNML